MNEIQENDYKEILLQAVAVIENARTNIARHLAVTASNTYWEIGKLLHEKKLESKHGSQMVRQLSVDLKERYPKMGMSPRNLWYMKTFYERYEGSEVKVQRAVALLPWSHTLLILSKDLKDADTMFYAQESVAKVSGGQVNDIYDGRGEEQISLSDCPGLFVIG